MTARVYQYLILTWPRRGGALLGFVLVLGCASRPLDCEAAPPLAANRMQTEGWFWFLNAVVHHDGHGTWIGPKELLTDADAPFVPSKLLIFYEPSALDCRGSDRNVRLMFRIPFPFVSGRGRWNHDRLGLEVDCICSVEASGLSDQYQRFDGLLY